MDIRDLGIQLEPDSSMIHIRNSHPGVMQEPGRPMTLTKNSHTGILSNPPALLSPGSTMPHTKKGDIGDLGKVSMTLDTPQTEAA
jgi:hypothetical protein